MPYRNSTGDIKQDNILISGNSPENYVVKIIDFDLAQFIETAVPIQHIQNDMNPPDYYKKLKDTTRGSWIPGNLKNTKSYAYISNYLNKSPLAKFGSAVNLLVPNRKKSLKEKVLMLVKHSTNALLQKKWCNASL
ncbi:hypothetical protein BDF22DRAFT_740191 [Syncephalis plumigaleata]|nr:hypothetical protein BDF22DRAFT_740191 [Syncephalis plumigaleata]